MLQVVCRLFIFACMSVTLVHASELSREHHAVKNDVSNDELIMVLADKDYESSVKVLNRVKSMTYSAPLAPTLIRLWNGEGVAKVDANFVSSPRIRIEFADVLLQMHRNGFGGLNAKAYEDYARSLVKSVDPDVARQAVLVLGVANNPKDVGLLSAIFADSGSRHWRAAALGLVGNCGVSESIIERMSEGAIPERGRFLRETWTAQKGYRAC